MKVIVRRFRRALVASMLAVGLASSSLATSSAPALADANYNPSNPLLALFPDICTLFASCITFTDSTAINGMNGVINQIQEGLMHVQDLKSGPLGALGGLGVGDPVGGNLLGTILGRRAIASQVMMGNSCNNTVATAGAGNRTDLLSLFGVQQAFGIGHLSAAQIASVVEQKIASTNEARNQCAAAESISRQASVQQSYYNLGSELDLGAAPDAGWI
jgi:hypothetical protein